MRSTSERLAALVLVVGVLAGCGGDTEDVEPVRATMPVTACPVTAEEVADAIGIDVDDPHAEVAGGGEICTFPLDTGGTVEVRIYDGYAEKGHAAFMRAFPDVEELEVQGRPSAWSASVGTLDVVDGDDSVQVQLFDAANAIREPRRVAIDLAERVLAR